MPDSSPAEERAVREGMPVVACLTAELFNVMQGHPTVVRTVDGDEVLLRLPTVGEALRFNREARDSLIVMMAGQPGWEPPPPMTRQQAADAVRPLR